MMKQYNVVYAPLALEDMESIYRYIALHLQAQPTAQKQINRIRQKIADLSIMPTKYAKVDWEPWFSMSIRRMTIDHYLVFYRVEEENELVTVIRILYGGRDIETLVKDL